MLSTMARSLSDTSENADLLVYCDEDQVDMYEGFCDWNEEFDGRVQIMFGDRVGLSKSLNRLVERFGHYDVYGHTTDDSIIKSPGWEPHLEAAVKSLPGGIGAILPHHDDLQYPGYPTVTRKWIDALGWYALPDTIHWGWDSAIRFLGQKTTTRHMGEHEFYIQHLSAMPVFEEDLDSDLRIYENWAATHGESAVQKLLDAGSTLVFPLPNIDVVL